MHHVVADEGLVASVRVRVRQAQHGDTAGGVSGEPAVVVNKIAFDSQIVGTRGSYAGGREIVDDVVTNSDASRRPPTLATVLSLHAESISVEFCYSLVLGCLCCAQSDVGVVPLQFQALNDDVTGAEDLDEVPGGTVLRGEKYRAYSVAVWIGLVRDWRLGGAGSTHHEQAAVVGVVLPIHDVHDITGLGQIGSVVDRLERMGWREAVVRIAAARGNEVCDSRSSRLCFRTSYQNGGRDGQGER